MDISDLKIIAVCCGFGIVENAAYSGRKVGFAFVADRNNENDQRIVEWISVAQKPKFENLHAINKDTEIAY